MQTENQFDEAIQRIDAANRQDPRTEMVDGRAEPREWFFARRVVQWVERLAANPSEELLLAARAHTIRRWMIPRDRYPMSVAGYHHWRNALAVFHADEAEAILREVGYPAETVQAVRAFITRANWPANAEACVLEDADCLVFLETKLAGYIDAWGEPKTVRILQRTWKKMTPEGRARALELKLGAREMELVRRAVGGRNAETP